MNRSIRWLLISGGMLAVGIGTAIAIRAQMLPCGWFDRNSGCIASTQLDIQDLGFVPGTARPTHWSLDLSADAEAVLVGLKGFRRDSTGDGRHLYGVLALFDPRTGELMRVLRDVEDRDDSHSEMREAALSLDGQLVASSAIEADDHIVLVQQTSDGEVVDRLDDGSPYASSGCLAQLDFSPDNQLLQCRFELYQRNNGSLTPIADLLADDNDSPRLSDYSLMDDAIALDGTEIDFNAIEQTDGRTTSLPFTPQVEDARRWGLVFAPDSSRFLELQRTIQPHRGFWAAFRPESSVTVWTKDAEILRVLTTHTRVRRVAWSRDSRYFALLSQDLALQVFSASELPEE